MRAVLLSRAGMGVPPGADSSPRSPVPHREITKPLVPIGKATTLLVEVLGLLCKGMVSAWGLCGCCLRDWHPAWGQVGMWELNPPATREMVRGIPFSVWVMGLAWPSHSIFLPGDGGHGMLMPTVCPTGPEDCRKAVAGWRPELEGIPA